MENAPLKITVFEHQVLRTGGGDNRITPDLLKSLQIFYGEKGVPYYSLIHNGVRFNEFVGVLQVGRTTIEVLPKADKNDAKNVWRDVLIGMLNVVGAFNIHAPSSSDLRLRANSILDLYFELFVKELEYLLARGLVKKYRKTEGNTTALKGTLQFSKHLSENIVHQERFYVRYSIYDKEHQIHAILYKALKLLSYINTNARLSSRLGALLLDFPEMKDIKVIESTFTTIVINRKTQPYVNALEIARLILLNYHPDVSKGSNNTLALMFDMNLLWEQFVYVTLKKHKLNSTTIAAQNTKIFWKPESGYRSIMKPDIVLNKGKDNCIVLDTKWKNLNGSNPSPDDLRQMYVYMKYYNTKQVALVYPAANANILTGSYYKEATGILGDEECSVISIAVDRDIKKWQKQISKQISTWVMPNGMDNMHEH